MAAHHHRGEPGHDTPQLRRGLQTLIIDSQSDLGDLFPTPFKFANKFVATPFATLEQPSEPPVSVDSDSEGAAASSPDAGVLASIAVLLRRTETAVATHCPPPPLPPSPRPPSVVDVTPASSEKEEKDPQPKQAETTHRKAKLLLMTLALQDDGEVKTFNIKTPFAAAMSQEKAVRGEMIQNPMVSGSNDLSESTDCVSRFTNHSPKLKDMPAVAILLSTSNFKSDMSTDLRKSGVDATEGLSLAVFLPLNLKARKKTTKLGKAEIQRRMDQALGEHSSKLGKVGRMITLTTKIDSHWVLITFFANATHYILSIAEFDPTSIDFDDAPFLHVASHRTAIIVHSRQYRKFTENNDDITMQLNYYVFNIFDRVFTIYTKVLDEEGSIATASPNPPSGSAVNADHIKLAKRTLLTELKKLESIIAGAVAMECNIPVFVNSEHHKPATNQEVGRKTQRCQQKTCDSDSLSSSRFSTEVPPTKPPAAKKVKRTGLADRAPRPLRVSRDVKWIDLMDITFPKGEKICAANLRDGSHGCSKKGDGCKMCHNPPVMWSKAICKLMRSFARRTQGVEWNMYIVDMSITKVG